MIGRIPPDAHLLLGRGARIEDGLVYTSAGYGWDPAEYFARRRYEIKPERKAHRAAYEKAWKERNREKVRDYNREWMRRHRERAA